MPRLNPVTHKALESVEQIHLRVMKKLASDCWKQEKVHYERIQTAAEIGRKKHIMTEKRIREMCEEYIKRYGP